MTITWRNVASRGDGGAAALLAGASRSIGEGASRITGALQNQGRAFDEREQETVKRSNDALLDVMSSFKSVGELEQARESGAIDQLLGALPKADAGLARGAFDNQLRTLRSKELEEEQYQQSGFMREAKPAVDTLDSMIASKEFDRAEQFFNENQDVFRNAGMLGDISQRITQGRRSEDTWQDAQTAKERAERQEKGLTKLRNMLPDIMRMPSINDEHDLVRHLENLAKEDPTIDMGMIEQFGPMAASAFAAKGNLTSYQEANIQSNMEDFDNSEIESSIYPGQKTTIQQEREQLATVIRDNMEMAETFTKYSTDVHKLSLADVTKEISNRSGVKVTHFTDNLEAAFAEVPGSSRVEAFKAQILNDAFALSPNTTSWFDMVGNTRGEVKNIIKSQIERYMDMESAKVAVDEWSGQLAALENRRAKHRASLEKAEKDLVRFGGDRTRKEPEPTRSLSAEQPANVATEKEPEVNPTFNRIRREEAQKKEDAATAAADKLWQQSMTNRTLQGWGYR